MEVYLKLRLAHLAMSGHHRLSENCLSTLGVGMQHTNFLSSQLSKTWLTLADWSSLGTSVKHGWILGLCFSVS